MQNFDLFARFLVESNLIENIEDNLDFVREELRCGAKDGHAGAILYLEKLAQDKSHLLIEADIKKVQGLITKEQGEKRFDLILKPKWIGNYRDIGVTVGGRTCPHYFQVPNLMKSLALQIQEWQKCWKRFPEMLNFANLADFHYEFEMIHPFADGNGRTGRAIVFYLMLYMDREPFVFTNEDKYLYYFPPLQRQNKMLMRNYFYRKSGNLG
ncbi:MAG: Fic family protein [Candidatus Harrisonbacteria bacterium]|nr:Fic family protein [Candidatus Harrisonbacteria bacterium]